MAATQKFDILFNSEKIFVVLTTFKSCFVHVEKQLFLILSTNLPKSTKNINRIGTYVYKINSKQELKSHYAKGHTLIRVGWTDRMIPREI